MIQNHKIEDYHFRGLVIPAHMIAGIRRFADDGIPPGDFLAAVLCNDLSGAANRADETNFKLLGAYAAYLYNNVPQTCWGSRHNYSAHIVRKREERECAHG